MSEGDCNQKCVTLIEFVPFCSQKRIDELLMRITGYSIYGLTPVPSVMDMAALDARDQCAPGYQPRINTDVRRRHHLAG